MCSQEREEKKGDVQKFGEELREKRAAAAREGKSFARGKFRQ